MALMASMTADSLHGAGVLTAQLLGQCEAKEPLIDQRLDTIVGQATHLLRFVAALGDDVSELLDPLEQAALEAVHGCAADLINL